MSLKIEHLTQTVNSSDQLLCCFDVSKASLSLYTEYQYTDQPDADQPEPEGRRRASRIEEEIPNQTGAIEQLLDRLEGLAEEIGLRGLRVLAEPTGGYERKLLQTAQGNLGFPASATGPASSTPSTSRSSRPSSRMTPGKPITKIQG